MAPAVSASSFSLPLPRWLQPTSPRVAQYDHHKRKRQSDPWSDVEDGNEDTTDATSMRDESVSVGPSPVLTPNESHQYRVAGLSFDQEIPQGNFPHVAAPRICEAKNRRLSNQLSHGLANLSTPVYPPQSPAYTGSLRLQHLAALTTVLHRCLLQGDFTRAGRAWGIIMREQFRGVPVDPRIENRWGIGAEILLRRDQQGASRDPATGSRTPLPFTHKGFTDAKEYYESLILHHPYLRTHPHSISALHYYPAMFGLWVYVAQEESQFERDRIEDEESSEISDDESTDGYGEHRLSNRKEALIARVRSQELEQAQQIATRIDPLLASPPYSDSPELLELRGMVSLWIGDLLALSLVKPPPEFLDDYGYDAMATDEMDEPLEVRREQTLAMEKRKVELHKSQEFLEKAQKRRRGVSYNMEHLHIESSSAPNSPSPALP
ncbi:hypothetical protein PENSTE_c001G02553 [Penicillium steckii]|uniref:Transcription initiation factor Rrn11 n=1 Tax=Penicillium steckii TaxID=303698 RepID=A0A1V6TYS2_9EURO|nr:hypothetical protein PENSTE_c001G02553 [Penicillium steckii]